MRITPEQFVLRDLKVPPFLRFGGRLAEGLICCNRRWRKHDFDKIIVFQRLTKSFCRCDALKLKKNARMETILTLSK
ncbi:hypothetical protein, partial [Cypionkella sp.]|uniref:hypothetical protein n=1 Tax=Cypionkella sp. TaxID=2811411 RepID=UPI0037527164